MNEKLGEDPNAPEGSLTKEKEDRGAKALSAESLPGLLSSVISEEDPSNSQVEAGILRLVAMSRSGPLPHPEELVKYEKILPGSADRIVKMAESEQRHRHEIENERNQAEIRDSGRGVHYAFILGLAGIIGGVVVALFGAPTAGSIIGLGSLASLVGTFIYGTRQQNQTDEAKEPPKSNHK